MYKIRIANTTQEIGNVASDTTIYYTGGVLLHLTRGCGGLPQKSIQTRKQIGSNYCKTCETMKTNIFIIILILLCSCNSQKPIATAHIERIEGKLMPVAVGADTIEITEYRLRSTDLTPSPAGLPLKQGGEYESQPIFCKCTKVRQLDIVPLS